MRKREIEGVVLDGVKRMIQEGRTVQEIARYAGVSENCLRRNAKILGFCWPSKTGPRQGPMSKLWKGGLVLNAMGYVYVHAPWHPHCEARLDGRKKKDNDRSYNVPRYMPMHRLVIENSLGRYLLPTEVVHHINGVRHDNSLENLELCSSNASHLAETLKGKVPAWTEQGKLGLQLAANLRRGKRIGCRLTDDEQYIEAFRRWKTSRQTSARNLSQMVSKRERERIFSRSKQLLSTLTWFPRLVEIYSGQDQTLESCR